MLISALKQQIIEVLCEDKAKSIMESLDLDPELWMEVEVFLEWCKDTLEREIG